jgi:hypothetical protein
VIDVGTSLRTAARPAQVGNGLFVVREIALWLLLYPLYLLTRDGAKGAPEAALRHARELVGAERSLGLAFEHGMQRLATASPIGREAFDVYYEWAFYPLLAAVLVWLGLTHRDVYRHSRRALFFALAIASIFFILFPTAPPRMLPGLGIQDTVGMQQHDAGSFHGISYNPYAAMPSMHVGWSLIVAAGAFRAVRNNWVRVAAIVHPLLMSAATIATGNHYLLDCVAGAVIGLVAIFALSVPSPAGEQSRSRVPMPATAGVACRRG